MYVLKRNPRERALPYLLLATVLAVPFSAIEKSWLPALLPWKNLESRDRASCESPIDKKSILTSSSTLNHGRGAASNHQLFRWISTTRVGST
jgi:hypothetical protein